MPGSSVVWNVWLSDILILLRAFWGEIWNVEYLHTEQVLLQREHFRSTSEIEVFIVV